MNPAQQDVSQQDQLVKLADRTARAVETIRTVVVIWAILTVFAGLMLIFEATKAANGG